MTASEWVMRQEDADMLIPFLGQVGSVITNRNASRQEFERLLVSFLVTLPSENLFPRDVCHFMACPQSRALSNPTIPSNVEQTRNRGALAWNWAFSNSISITFKLELMTCERTAATQCLKTIPRRRRRDLTMNIYGVGLSMSKRSQSQYFA